ILAVLVCILVTNCNRPVAALEYEYTEWEEQPAGHVIGSLVNDVLTHSLSLSAQEIIEANLQFRVDPAFSKFFKISQNGSLQFAQQLDRDLLCDATGRPVFEDPLKTQDRHKKLSSVLTKPGLYSLERLISEAENSSSRLVGPQPQCALRFNVYLDLLSNPEPYHQRLIQSHLPPKIIVTVRLKDLNDNYPKWLRYQEEIAVSDNMTLASVTKPFLPLSQFLF
ncbi:hypothetical protein Ciccas_010177, partial [Cichlidogyrus casuarinus]